MINKYMSELMKELAYVRPLGTTRHVPDRVFRPVESELLLGGKYIEAVPRGYPSDLAEEHGFRKLRSAADGQYNGLKLRTGATTLHARPRVSEKNLDSAALFYLPDEQVEEVAGVKIRASTEGVVVMLHENGVVSACFTSDTSPFVFANSWYPTGMEGYGGLPYPKAREYVSADMQRILTAGGYLWSATADKIPDLVMLAVNTRNRCHEGKI